MRVIWLLTALGLVAGPVASRAQSAAEEKIADATAVLTAFTADESDSIPTELLQRAHGIAVIPGLIRGGFFIGGRRGKGILVVRSENGQWSNPSFINLTGGSIGWQFGAETTDLVLVFANDRAVRNIAAGKFTLGGDASAVAGPRGRHNTAAVTFQAEIYAYVKSRGLFAGAALEGARLGMDTAMNDAYYSFDLETTALGPQTPGTPMSARRFLLMLEQASSTHVPSGGAQPTREQEEARTFPLGSDR